MFSFLVSFVVSALLTLLVIKQARLHGPALDGNNGVQKFHVHAVARIGGLPIFLAVFLSSWITVWRVPAMTGPMMSLLLCAAIAFAGGIVEDYTGRVSPMRRLLLTMGAALLAYYVLDARVDRLDLIILPPLSIHYLWISLPLTVLAVAGVANAVNIIDGFNGLASVVSICMLLSLGYVALQVNDMFVLVAALMVAGATTGFLIWNYPVGLIFLGDGGAYFIGFMLGELALLLVMRNPQVSTWYAALLLIYPTFETLFSVYRRMFIRGKSPAMPDGIHLHSLIFRRVVQWAVGHRDARALMRRNSMTSPYLWMFSLTAVVPATLFWQYTWVLMLCCLIFVGSYIWLYFRIVRFKSPRWMILRKKH